MFGVCFVVIFSVPIFCDAYLIADFVEWNSFKKNHSKHYDSFEEDLHHFRIFVDNKYKVDEHNLHHDNGVASYRLGLNWYSDLSHEEFVRTMNKYKHRERLYDGRSEPFYDASDVDLPYSMDWRRKDAVNRKVGKQIKCGSCYAFAAVAAIESHYFIKTRQKVSLSSQHIVDCSKLYGNFGCDGGYAESAFDYVRDHGIPADSAYPYVDKDNGLCKRAKKSKVKINGYATIQSGSEKELQKALVLHGPIVVSIDTKGPDFKHYSSGIYHEPKCSNTMDDLDHSVLLVGYGTDKYHRDYWILKNWWGSKWGESGYFRLSRNQNNHCGIATDALYPIL